MFDIQMRPNRYYRSLFRDIPRQQVLDMVEWCCDHNSAGGFNLSFYPHEEVPDTMVPDFRSGSFWFELEQDFVLFELRWR